MNKPQTQAHALEGRYGFLLGPFFKLLFSGVAIPELYREAVLGLSHKGHIVYVHGARNDIDTILLSFRMGQEHLPKPRLIFGKSFDLLQPVGLSRMPRGALSDTEILSYMREAHTASMIYLEQAEGECEDPLLKLIRLQLSSNVPIYLVPQRLVYRRTPVKVKRGRSKHSDQLSLAQKLTSLVRGDERGLIEFGEPINLKDIVGHLREGGGFLETTAAELRRELNQRLTNLGTSASGAPLRSREFLIGKTAKDPALQAFLRAHVGSQNQSYQELSNRVLKNLNQIAADVKPSAINFIRKILTFIFNNIYDGLDVDKQGMEKVREAARKGSIVYVPCHKSHIDYLVMSYMLYYNWMSVPYIAAGVNLSFFPVGTLLRNCGAFFMRRTFHNDPVYAQTFSAYIRTILSERIPFEFFIEGTRSRSGKLMMPKKGLLSMIAQGWESGLTPDVIFVPLYVGYDTVVEEGSYINEMQGAEKKDENFFELLKAGRILKNRYGKVYVRFAEPFSLNEYMQDKPTYATMETEERQELYDDLAFNLIDAIYKQTVATPYAIASAVMIARVTALDEAMARSTFTAFSDYLRATGHNLASSLNDVDQAFDDTLSRMVDRGLVTLDRSGASEDEPGLCVVASDKRIHLEYYKNNVLNCFTPAALIACVILRHPEGLTRDQFLAEVKFLAGLLRKEFILDMEAFAKALDHMLENGYIALEDLTYRVAPAGQEVLSMLAGLIENYLESYLTVARNIDRVARKNTKDALKIINKRASRMYKKGEINRAEALCLPVYKGALDTFRAMGLIGPDNVVANRADMEKITYAIENYLKA